VKLYFIYKTFGNVAVIQNHSFDKTETLPAALLSASQWQQW